MNMSGLLFGNASTVCDAIAETLTEMDPENKDIYRSNEEAYQKKLANLDAEYQNTVENRKQNTLLFCGPFSISLSDRRLWT